MSVAPYHTPVLLREVLHYLVNDPDGVYVDATLGGGGHSEAILRQLSPAGRLIGIDTDHEALEFAERRLQDYGPRFTATHGNFRTLGAILDRLGVVAVRGVLFDLGVSSHQIEEGGRGFSFQREGPLDMRMDRSSPLTASDVVNGYDGADLERLLRHYGEERLARRVARAIVRHRMEEPFLRTSQLSAVVAAAAPGRFQTKTLARVFQALRIEVNGELEALRSALAQAIGVLAQGGTLVVISYHSLEDRLVKLFFSERSARVRPPAHPLATPVTVEPDLELLTRKPVVPGSEEKEINVRSRSAKLRAARRISTGVRQP